ncbi:hypothetical protein CCB80_10250 [Armatimonadetes bacterium Uphvl-Ar1]|nr:hypothetical protein CCB80_10250 [Armatimonadetes bacterium Uphvl-Ar1]
MSASVLYTNFGGMLVHEDRGGVERTYVHDEMGNTRYLLDSSNVTDTYSYTPYGQVTHVGTSVTPFTFIGALGYFATGWSHLTSYVRARWYSSVSGSWGSVDPIWPMEPAYGYVNGNPAMKADPSGFMAVVAGLALGIGIGITLPAWLIAILIGATLAVVVWLLLHAINLLRSLLCKAIRKRMKDTCGDDTPGRASDVCGDCTWGDSCSSLMYKAAAWSACANLRMLEMMLCYPASSRSATHVGEWLNATAGAINCELIFLMKCAGMDGRWPNRWTPPWKSFLR